MLTKNVTLSIPGQVSEKALQEMITAYHEINGKMAKARKEFFLEKLNLPESDNDPVLWSKSNTNKISWPCVAVDMAQIPAGTSIDQLVEECHNHMFNLGFYKQIQDLGFTVFIDGHEMHPDFKLGQPSTE